MPPGEAQSYKNTNKFQTVILAIAGLTLLLAPPPAHAFWELTSEDGDTSLEATGAFRLSGALLHVPDSALYPDGDDGQVASVIRLMLEGGLSARVSYEVNLFMDLARTPGAAVGGAMATVGSFATPYRQPRLAWDFWQEGTASGQLGLDRLLLRVDLERLQITAGRMPVNPSVTSIFSPNDFFAPFASAAVNKIYKPGVDALQLSVSLSPLSQLVVTGVLGNDAGGVPAWASSALLLRASTVLWNTELALLGAKLAGRWVVGASLQGEVGPVTIRAEGHAGFPDHDGDGALDDDDPDTFARPIHGRVALGVDRQFAWRNATIGLEAMYQTDGALRPAGYPARLLSLLPDELPHMARLYLGLQAGGEILPILRTSALVLVNTQDGSGMAALMLLYNISDEADFVGGLLVPWGEAPPATAGAAALQLPSEYGLYPLMIFLETRFYF